MHVLQYHGSLEQSPSIVRNAVSTTVTILLKLDQSNFAERHYEFNSLQQTL